MDNIDRIMKEADRLGFGVSYGKYRAAYPNGSGGVVLSAPKPKPPEKPSGTCKLCGKTFVRRHANALYCSAECKIEAEKKRQRDWYGKKADIPSVAVCVICGADFNPRAFAVNVVAQNAPKPISEKLLLAGGLTTRREPVNGFSI